MLAADDNFSVPVEARRSSANDLSASDIRWILRRGWLWPVAGTIAGLILALTVIGFMPQLYTSSARILVDRSMNRFLQDNKIVDEPSLDDVDMAGQFYVLSSDSIIVPVIRSLHLTSDPEFVGRSLANASARDGDVDPCSTIFSRSCFFSGVGKATAFVKWAIGRKPPPAIDPNTLLERTAVETFLRQLNVERGDVNNVINVSFSSEDPNKAAKIANAVADTYVATGGERRLKSSQLVTQLLEDRLVDIKQQSVNADRALQEFKAENNLKGAAIPDNGLITRLRSEYVDLERKAKEISDAVGPDHLAVVKIRKQMEGLNAAMRSEEDRLAGAEGLGSATGGDGTDFDPGQIAADNSELSASLSKLDGDKLAKYRELEISARTLQTLYNVDLRKFNELNQNRPDTQDAHIITRAAPPLRKNANKSLLVLAGGVIFGFLSGLGAAIGKEWVAGVYRTSEQVTRGTGIYCVILPKVDMRKSSGGRLADYVLDAPFSRYTEAIRKLRASMRAYPGPNGDKVIGVVSAVANEGKSTVVHNFAALLSAYSKCSTLIIDCDLHRRNLTAELTPNASVGLLEALEDPSRLLEFVSKRERSGVDVLPCALSKRNPNVAELLGSPRMAKLLDIARENYDFIVIEIAPIMSVVDIKMIERFVDKFIFVVEWGKTKRSLVEDALSEAEVIDGRIACMVLNKADTATLRTIESYKGRRIAEYYEE
ncbi:GumC family protein [Hyphomicrobium sp.]|jgi:succinoglycan biosynthesis transport protein ExoP|uniref:GumC family protein n=1 Tax=Hyphomicrobium sp. TaxID=82 RepID=UPI003568FA11